MMSGWTFLHRSPRKRKPVQNPSTEMTVAELSAKLRSRGIEQAALRELAIEFNKKLTIPLSCLVFALIALPLGIRAHRSIRARGFTVGLAIVLIFYLMRLSGEALVETGRLSPVIGTWAPNAVFAIAGITSVYVLGARATSLGVRPILRPRSWIASCTNGECPPPASPATTIRMPRRGLDNGRSPRSSVHRTERYRDGKTGGEVIMKILDRYLIVEFLRNLLLITACVRLPFSDHRFLRKDPDVSQQSMPRSSRWPPIFSSASR